MNTDSAVRLPLLSIALLSATSLAYEILLVRLFSIIQWHNYAYMVISLALLGYGASGTYLTFCLKALSPRFRCVFPVSIALFAVAIPACFLVAQSIAFNPDEVVYDAGQWRHLAAMYLLLSLPFFFAANAIGLSLARFRARLSQVYAADLLGAGLGSLGIVGLLFVLPPMSALKCLTVLCACTALVATWEVGFRGRGIRLSLVALMVAAVSLPQSWLHLSLSPYKDLSQALRVTGTRMLEQRSGPLGFLTVLDNPVIPLRLAPGLSLNANTEPPRQLGLFIDGNGPIAINRAAQEPSDLDYLDQLTSALPYHLQEPGRVMVIGSGGGTDVLQALHLGAERVDAIELNPQIFELVNDRFGEFSGHLYSNPRVRPHRGEARGFLHIHSETYNLIQLPLLDSYGSSSTGLLALNEDYLYTVEAFQQYLGHLAPGGFLAVNRWIRLPLRDSLKVFATAIAALQEQGLTDISARLVIIRGLQTSTMLVKNGLFAMDELDSIRQFCAQRSFDLGYLPGMSVNKANRFNRLARPYLFEGARQLLGDSSKQFIDSYKFDLTPAIDDRPYFFHFFRWKSLPEMLELYGRGGESMVESGYLVLVATLFQAIAASLLMILLPLLLKRRSREGETRPHYGPVLVYFASLGLAFLFLEIAFIQKLTLFLHHPLYAVAVSLTAFLLFAGLGSLWTLRLAEKSLNRGINGLVAVMVSLGLLYLVGLDTVFAHLMALPDRARIPAGILLIAPLAFCLGMPFPLGLARLGQYAPELVPWAWGINGCASVVSAVLAALLAIHFGFSAVLVAALALYLVAAAVFPRMGRVGADFL